MPKKLSPEEIRKIQTETLQRTLTVENRNIDEEARTVQVAFSSESVVERYWGNEILNHDADSVRLGRLQNGGAVLVGHNHSDQVGVIESVSIDADRVGRAVLRFGRSARAQEVFGDIVDGIRRHISVGYRIHELKLESENRDTGDRNYRVTDWEPFEVSIVSVPADDAVGVGRSAEPGESPVLEPEPEPEPTTETTETAERSEEEPDMPKPTQSPDKPTVSVEEVRDQEIQRMRSIEAMGKKFDAGDLARTAMEKGTSVEEFRAKLLEHVEERQATARPVTDLDLTASEHQQYSLLRAINAQLTGDWSDAGFELECSRAIAERLERDARGFFVPYDVQKRNSMATGPGTGLSDAGAIVGTDHLASQFIENLRAQSVLGRMGARFLPGLVGDVSIPRQEGSAAFNWLDEDEDNTDSEFPLGSVTLTPRTVAGSVPMTRRLIKQSSPSIEALVMNDLRIGSALAIDLAGLEGTGLNGQPLGIVGQTGVSTQSIADAGGVPTHAELVGFESQVDTDNALDGSLYYLTTPGMIGNLKTAKIDAGSGRFLLENGIANGYSVMRSSQISTGRIMFGNFSDVLIGMWGVLDVMIDTAAKAKSGGLVIRVFQDIDIAVRHPESFCIND